MLHLLIMVFVLMFAVSSYAFEVTGDSFKAKFKIDSMGNRYAHIINPLSGYPSKTNILSVTVKAPSCIDADAYATALHTMTIEEIKDFFNNNSNITFIKNSLSRSYC